MTAVAQLASRLRTNSFADLPLLFVEFGFGDGPWSTAEVIAVASGLGYDIDAQGLRYLLSRQVLKSPRKFGNALAWRAAEVVSLLEYLHGTRKWLPGYFTELKTIAETDRDVASLNRSLQVVSGYRDMPLAELQQAHGEMADGPFRDVLALILEARREGTWQ